MNPAAATTPFTCAVLVERIGPYHFARLSALAERARTVAVESFAMDSTYAWNRVADQGRFERHTLFAKADAGPRADKQLATRVAEVLTRIAPSVVAIPGWADKAALAALRWCLKTSTPAVVLSASSAVGKQRAGWREAVKRRVVRLFSAGVGGGTPQADYLAALGLPRERVFPGCDVVDNEYFSARTDDARTHAPALRASLGLPENFFLTICRFIEEKNLPCLLRAYAAYKQQAGAAAWKFVLAGDGPLKPQVLALREQFGLRDDLLLPGFKQYDELPPYYALAGAFVLPSVSETWGLVVNEAMAAGLPVLVSTHCGCATDLVVPGENGFQFDPYDADALTAAMLNVSAADCDRAALGQASRAIIADWSPARFADALPRAAAAAQAAPRPCAGLLDRLLLWALLHR